MPPNINIQMDLKIIKKKKKNQPKKRPNENHSCLIRPWISLIIAFCSGSP